MNIICKFEGKYISNNIQLVIMGARDQILLTDYVDENSTISKSTDDIMIQEIEYCEGNPSAIIFGSDNIIRVDWDYYGAEREIRVKDVRYHSVGA